MKLILFFCLCVLAFSQSLESQNEELKLKNKLLLKTLRELAVGESSCQDKEGVISTDEEGDLTCGDINIDYTMCDLTLSDYGSNAPAGASYDDSATLPQLCPVTLMDICDTCASNCEHEEDEWQHCDEIDVAQDCSDHRYQSLCANSCCKWSRLVSSEEQVADDGGCYNRCREAGGSQSECASDCPMPDETVAQHEQSTEEEVGGNQWQCHRYGSGESDSWCQSAGDPFVFTRGNNAAYPGCGGCWCCKRKEWPCRSTNKVGHNRSISPGDICNTDWTHVTYWRARHEYCKNDKGNWGCQYGYKRVGWNDYCCNQWESRNTNRCQCR